MYINNNWTLNSKAPSRHRYTTTRVGYLSRLATRRPKATEIFQVLKLQALMSEWTPVQPTTHCSCSKGGAAVPGMREQKGIRNTAPVVIHHGCYSSTHLLLCPLWRICSVPSCMFSPLLSLISTFCHFVISLCCLRQASLVSWRWSTFHLAVRCLCYGYGTLCFFLHQPNCFGLFFCSITHMWLCKK